MRKTIILLLVVVLLFAACTPTGEKVDKTSPFLGGTEGVTVDFLNFRTDVFDGGNDPFDIVVQLENKGEFTVPKQDLRVKVSGINPAEFNKLEENLAASPEDDLLAIRKDPQANILKSPPITVEFTELSYLGRLVGATQKFPVVVDVCYLYTTNAVTHLCILSEVLTPKPGRVCEVNEAKASFNSGSPVHVENVKEFARGKDKVGFTFDLKHVGTGSVYEKATRCVNERFKNKVLVRVDTRLDGLVCTGLSARVGAAVEGTATLLEGTKTISCTQTITRSSDFEQPITITLEYDYDIQKRTEITVKASGQE